ncbi:MAG TPA: hypothetical protein VFR84_02940 [Candidatus Angelobacter sp.]|nr:hypothetical protein [Candidatus Angelobacter sp.]
MRQLFMLLCVIASLTAHCGAENSCVWTETGSTTATAYTNPKLGFSYSFPASLTPQDAQLLPKDPKGKGAILFALWKTPRDLETPTVILFVEDPKQYRDPTALAYAHRIENTAKRTAQTSGVRAFDLAGMAFFRVDSQELRETVFNTAITGQIDGCEVSFQLKARTQQEIDKLVESLTAIKRDHHQAR